MRTKTLGVLGGLGPLSGVYFCEMLTRHTRADRDQDHLNFLLSSWAETPDRTDYILGRSEDNPSQTMIAQVNTLIAAGAEVIAIPCNTAHYFYDRISESSSVPVINIIRETVAFCQQQEIQTVGVLATEGTVGSGAYESVCREHGVGYLTCTPAEQVQISNIIYNQIKKGQAPDRQAFDSVVKSLLDRGCQRIVLGCTELSLLKKKWDLDDLFIDSLEVLAYASIEMCGKEPVDFSPAFLKYQPMKGTNLCC